MRPDQQIRVLPEDSQGRKEFPIFSGFLAYFPDAAALIARRSWLGNRQHNPDNPEAPLRWDMTKSPDELDAMMRHLLEGEWDALAWRAMAQLQREAIKGWLPAELRESNAQEE